MKYSLTQLKGNGFTQLRQVEKVLRLIELLNEINKHPTLHKSLALKGGTPLNLLLWNVPRLSIDLDFNYIGSVSREKMLIDRELIHEAIKKIAKFFDYKLSYNDKYSNRTYTLRYIPYNSVNYDETLQIDINYILRVSIFNTKKSTSKKVFGKIKINKAHILSVEEILAGKLSAFVSRLTPRDIFDAYKISLNIRDFDFKKLKTCYIFYRCLQEEGFINIESKIKMININEMKKEIRQFININEKIKYEKIENNLLKLFKRLHKLNKNEIKFIEQFRMKVFEPELIFNHNLKNIKQHPRVYWMFKMLQAD